MSSVPPIRPGQVNLPAEQAAESEPSAARLILTLGLAGFLSGLLLVLAHQVTQPLILANKAAALREAVFRVVPGAASMHRLVPSDSGLVVSDDGSAGEAVYAAYDDSGTIRGYAIAGEGAGYQDVIRLLYGFDPRSRTVTGMRVLDSRETPGLGDRIYKDAGFVAQFGSLSVDPVIELIKGAGERQAHQVHAITGATISSRAVVGIINAANEAWLSRLPGPGTEPPAPTEAAGHSDPETGGHPDGEDNPSPSADGKEFTK